METFLDVLNKHTIYRVITGSTAYGLNNPSSDRDEKAIVILPPEQTFHIGKEWETKTYHDPDIEFHSLKKAIRLLNSQNPTMLETLFVEENHIVDETKHGKWLRHHRHLFLSQNCYHAFGGYARDQLMRIKNGLHKATELDQTNHIYYTLERTLSKIYDKYSFLSSESLNLHQVYTNQKLEKDVDISINVDHISLTQLNSLFAELSGILKGYNKKNRTQKKPIKKSSKHAMHLVRLLLMGIEVLRNGEITVFRKEDKNLLLDIRNLKYSWEDIFNITEELFSDLEKAKLHSVLPRETDKRKINDLYYKILKDNYRITN